MLYFKSGAPPYRQDVTNIYLSTTNNQFHYTPITLDPHQEVITK